MTPKEHREYAEALLKESHVADFPLQHATIHALLAIAETLKEISRRT